MSAGSLYIVATPIGNLGDMTPRAVEMLRQVDLIAAEDTRHSQRLLQQFDIRTPLTSLHEHNERGQADKIVQRLLEGASVALISDAGTPLISDPGFVLVRQARGAGVKVVPVPGVSALIAALSAAGLPSDRFSFEGFVPTKRQARESFLQALAGETRTLIFYEAPHRILETLRAMRDCFGAERYVVVARELTKTFETIHGDRLDQLVGWVEADANQQRGEFVVLVQGAEKVAEREVSDEAMEVLRILLEELSVKQAAALAAKITGVKRKLLYQAALEWGQQDD